jgi:hypothetical protein
MSAWIFGILFSKIRNPDDCHATWLYAVVIVLLLQEKNLIHDKPIPQVRLGGLQIERSRLQDVAWAGTHIDL